MTRFIFIGLALGMALLLAVVTTAEAYGRMEQPPPPRPVMDCWNNVDAGTVECEVRK